MTAILPLVRPALGRRSSPVRIGAWDLVRLALVVLLVTFPVPTAGADDAPAPSAASEQRGSDIVVYGDRTRQALDRLAVRLATLGYRKAREGSGQTVFVGDERWKPAVVVDHEGALSFRRRQVSWKQVELVDANELDAPIAEAPQPSLVERGPPVPAVASRQTLSQRRAVRAVEREVLDGTRTEVQELREARFAVGLDQRLAGLSAELEAIWVSGRHQGAVLADPTARRAALGALWASRTESVEGEAVRAAIGDYLRAEVQGSATPFTADEVAQWTRVCGCEADWADR